MNTSTTAAGEQHRSSDVIDHGGSAASKLIADKEEKIAEISMLAIFVTLGLHSNTGEDLPSFISPVKGTAKINDFGDALYF
jgi:hypothetical protein